MLILTQLSSLFERQENPTESLEGGILQLMVACEGSRRLCCGSRKAGAWSVFFQYNQILKHGPDRFKAHVHAAVTRNYKLNGILNFE